MSVNKESLGMVKLLLQHKSEIDAKNNVSPGDNGVRVCLWGFSRCWMDCELARCRMFFEGNSIPAVVSANNSGEDNVDDVRFYFCCCCWNMQFG